MNRLVVFSGNSSYNQKGFTLLELLLSMTLFSTILVVTTAGFIGLSQTFNRGFIRKQLSEGIQQTAGDITQAIRTNSNDLPKTCSADSSDPDCLPSSDYAQLCFPANNSRYIWQTKIIAPATDPTKGGLYKTTGDCKTAIDTGKLQTMIDSRYFVRALSVSTVGGASSNLYQLQGIVTTSSDGLINGSAANPMLYTCVGSSNTASRSCAVQKIDMIISTRGGSS